MQVSDFNFELPEELIAQQPPDSRSDSRLLALDRKTGARHDAAIRDLAEWLDAGDLLVFNNTRVIPARLYATKASGGRVEILVERIVDENQALVQLRANRKPPADTRLSIDPGTEATDPELNDIELVVEGRQDEFWKLRKVGGGGLAWLELLEAVGHVPLPPYIRRAHESGDNKSGDNKSGDRDRYQTVYAEVPGAVAAPTAGLHFDAALLQALKVRGVESAFCTLHVGAGTFQPVRVDNVEDHAMHPEWLDVGSELVEKVERTRAAGKRVVAVGTTAVRALETAAAGELQPFRGDSRLFIYPGYEFRVVDAMVTNFHLPGSTLLMLVSAFAGLDNIQAAYRHAIEERYRFFSYGDAMLIG